jgi:hypothetical protein
MMIIMSDPSELEDFMKALESGEVEFEEESEEESEFRSVFVEGIPENASLWTERTYIYIVYNAILTTIFNWDSYEITVFGRILSGSERRIAIISYTQAAGLSVSSILVSLSSIGHFDMTKIEEPLTILGTAFEKLIEYKAKTKPPPGYYKRILRIATIIGKDIFNRSLKI